MILVDDREKLGRDTGPIELHRLIKANGVPCEKSRIEYGDICFEGNGPNGKILIGIERKTLHNMLNCIDDSQYSAHQRPGMNIMYQKSFLLIEGHWRQHEDGWLMEGFNDGSSWGYCKYKGSRVLYSKLYRYLLSVSMSGVTVIYSRNLTQTAYNACEMYHWFQKSWNNHSSLLSTQTLAVPGLDMQPSLVRKVAAQISNLGTKLSIEAEKRFKTTYRMINSSESDWMSIPKIGAKTAQQIIREIHTNRTK